MKKLWKWIKSLFSKKSGSGSGSSGSKFKYEKLEWLYGGFSGFRAVEDTSVAGLKVLSAKLENDKDGMRFEYQGNMWGYDYDHHDARMCLFCKTGSRWIGGFWEWGSIRRNFRDFKNIRGHHKGWDPSILDRAQEFAFVVTDKSGSKRSNVVTFKR